MVCQLVEQVLKEAGYCRHDAYASTHPLRHWDSKRENQGLLPEDVREERQEKARKELERREVGEKGKD